VDADNNIWYSSIKGLKVATSTDSIFGVIQEPIQDKLLPIINELKVERPYFEIIEREDKKRQKSVFSLNKDSDFVVVASGVIGLITKKFFEQGWIEDEVGLLFPNHYRYLKPSSR